MATEGPITGYIAGFPLKLRVYLSEAGSAKTSGTVVIWIAPTRGAQAVVSATATHDADGYWDIEVRAEDMAGLQEGSIAWYQIQETGVDLFRTGPLEIGKGVTAPA